MTEWNSTFRVGIYVCEMTYGPRRDLKVRWRPSMPRRLSDQEWDEYRAGRDSLLAEVATAIGGGVMVVEL
jgi:hypothetical protein